MSELEQKIEENRQAIVAMRRDIEKAESAILPMKQHLVYLQREALALLSERKKLEGGGQ